MMRELDLIGIHESGEHLTLKDSDGGTFTLSIDEALRAAVRRDRPRMNFHQAELSSPLRPREIQALLRAGHDASEVADAAGTAIERIQRYEGPILAEREHIATRARSFSVGRGGSPSLESIVRERLAARQAKATPHWDAWRREDGTWTLQILFSSGNRDRVGHWIVDTARQHVVPDDDEARWLTDADPDDDDDAAPRRRLSSVKNWVYDVEADGGVTTREEHHTVPFDSGLPPSAHSSAQDGTRESDTAAQLRVSAEHGRAGAQDSAEDSASDQAKFEDQRRREEMVDLLNAQRGRRGVAAEPDDDEPNWESAEIPPAHPAHSRPEDAQDSEIVELPGLAPVQLRDAASKSDGPDGARQGPEPGDTQPQPLNSENGLNGEERQGPDSTGDPEPEEARPTKVKPMREKRSKRPSVPSWDEIVFGSKPD